MKKIGCALAVLALLALLAAGGAAWWGWQEIHTPYQGYLGDARQLEVEIGSAGTAILDELEREGVIASALLARLYLYQQGDPPLQAGEYQFEGALTVPEVLGKLIRGEVVTHEVTLVEGLTLGETARALAEGGFGTEERFLELMRDPAPIADLDPDAPDLEGYLFPDTYRFTRRTPEEEIVAALVGNFRERYESTLEPLIEQTYGTGDAAAGEAPDLEPGDDDEPPTLREIVTLASIVEKEARIPDERPMIAGVYQNRLDRGIGLYADPTVIYAFKKLGTWDGNLTRADLQVDSPYNTYRYPGLPPGPIASPGLASLEAAAAPADIPYFYFVSRNDGTHVFAETLAEHNRNVERWQRQYWRERWARERREAAAGDDPRDGTEGPAPDAGDD